MTREEAIKFLELDKEDRGKCFISDAIDMAIEKLEQETVSKEIYDHEYFLRKEFEIKIDELQRQLEEQAVKAESVLNKIRAEIKSITPKAHIRTGKLSIDTELMIPLDRVLTVIDKYKGKSEN